jgi:hypothetical protein
MTSLNPKLTKANLELAKGGPNNMHTMFVHIYKSNNKVISQLQKVLGIEMHLRAKTLRRCNLRDLNTFPVDELFHHLFQMTRCGTKHLKCP